jgi:hypothetical protein|tara:strand:+ start:78 stop:404 length:327 start_codon:yes stop_codon:yes gene_type:complete
MGIITKGMGAILKAKAFPSNAARKEAGYTDKAVRTYTDQKTGKTRRDVVLVKGPVTGFNYKPKLPKAEKKGQGKLFTETRKKLKEFKQLELPLKRTFGPRKIKKAEIK